MTEQGFNKRKNDTATKLGDFRSSGAYMRALSQNKTTAATDYYYDANGNMVRDLNKEIGTTSANGISYNHLNLPSAVQVKNNSGGDKGSITYTYDAEGVKLKKTVAISVAFLVNSLVTTFGLINDNIYNHEDIQPKTTGEGRIVYNAIREYLNARNNAQQNNNQNENQDRN